MQTPIRHADLVARALGQLEGPQRVAVDAAIAADADVKRRFEEVSSHLLLYDRLPDAPPAPSFARIEAALDKAMGSKSLSSKSSATSQRSGYEAQGAAPTTAWPSWSAPGAFAAAAVVMLGLFIAGVFEPRIEPTSDPEAATIALGEGISREREMYMADAPAEMRLGDRIRMVLDGGARVEIESPNRVRLLAGGRAYFEVGPGPFFVGTPQGDVEVLGTAFEVDVRDELGVAVAEGNVRVAGNALGGGIVLAAGKRLVDGRVEPATNGHRPGIWFLQPRVTLRQAKSGAVAVGARARLVLTLENPGYVEMRTPIKAGTSAVFIDFTGPDGSSGTAVLPGNVVSGGTLPQPGGAVILGPRKALPFTVELDSPFTKPGLWRCKALFHSAEGRIVSPEIEIEVR